MDTYNEVYLPIELNKALLNILSNVHHYYRKQKKDIKEKELRNIYNSILNCPVLKDNIVWFNAWEKKHTGKAGIYFIKDSSDISKKIINVFLEKEKEYNQYVSSLSTLADNYDIIDRINNKEEHQLDYSCLITTKKYQECDIEMASEYVRDFFVYLNFEKLTELFKDINFSHYYGAIQDAFNKNEEDGNNKIIELLNENYHRLLYRDEIDSIVSNLTSQLNYSWQCTNKFGNDLDILIDRNMIFDSKQNCLNKEDHKKNIIKLINYYFWVKLAFQEEWKVLLYVPGVIAKESGGIPLGVNIGFKETVPLEIILFFKRAILLFFTRESVDFFEEKAKMEASYRTIEVNNLNRLLSDFQHILLKCSCESISWANSEKHNTVVQKIAEYIKDRGEYIKKLSDYILLDKKIDKSFIGYKISQILPPIQIFMHPLFKTKLLDFDILWSDAYENLLSLFCIIFSDSNNTDDVKEVCFSKMDIVFDSIKIPLPLQSQSVATIFEGLIHNSLLKHCEQSPLKLKIYIYVFKLSDKYVLGYWDTGEGFPRDAWEKIPRWVEGELDCDGQGDPTIGFTYWLIGKIVDHINNEYEFGYSVFDENNNCIHDSFSLEEFNIHCIQDKFDIKKLKKDRYRVVHLFRF